MIGYWQEEDFYPLPTETHGRRGIKIKSIRENVKFESSTGKISKISRQINDQYSIVDENGKVIVPED